MANAWKILVILVLAAVMLSIMPVMPLPTVGHGDAQASWMELDILILMWWQWLQDTVPGWKWR